MSLSKNVIYRMFRLFFSLRGGVAMIYFINVILLSLSLVNGCVPILIETYQFIWSYNLMNASSAYLAIGLFLTLTAVVGIIFNEKKLLLPVMFYDAILLIAHLTTFGFLVQSKHAFIKLYPYCVMTYISKIGFGYFAFVIEFNFYRDLTRKMKARPEGIPESVIILPLNTRRPMSSQTIMQQHREQEGNSGSARENEPGSRVYGMSEAMIRFMRGTPLCSTRTGSQRVIENHSSVQGSISGVFYNPAMQNAHPKTPPPPYKP